MIIKLTEYKVSSKNLFALMLEFRNHKNVVNIKYDTTKVDRSMIVKFKTTVNDEGHMITFEFNINIHLINNHIELLCESVHDDLAEYPTNLKNAAIYESVSANPMWAWMRKEIKFILEDVYYNKKEFVELPTGFFKKLLDVYNREKELEYKRPLGDLDHQVVVYRGKQFKVARTHSTSSIFKDCNVYSFEDDLFGYLNSTSLIQETIAQIEFIEENFPELMVKTNSHKDMIQYIKLRRINDKFDLFTNHNTIQLIRKDEDGFYFHWFHKRILGYQHILYNLRQLTRFEVFNGELIDY